MSLGVTYEDTKELIDLCGPPPTGYMVLSPNGRISFLFTRANRTPPQTNADRATLFSAVTAYTGLVRIEAEDRFVITADLARRMRHLHISYRAARAPAFRART